MTCSENNSYKMGANWWCAMFLSQAAEISCSKPQPSQKWPNPKFHLEERFDTSCHQTCLRICNDHSQYPSQLHDSPLGDALTVLPGAQQSWMQTIPTALILSADYNSWHGKENIGGCLAALVKEKVTEQELVISLAQSNLHLPSPNSNPRAPQSVFHC